MRRVMLWRGSTCCKVFMTDASDSSAAKVEADTLGVQYDELEFDQFQYGNIDVSKTYKELSDSLKTVIHWLNSHEFAGSLKTYNTDRAELVVSKNNVSDTLTLTSHVLNPAKRRILDYMEEFGKSFALKEDIEKLRALKQAKEGKVEGP